MSIHFKIAPSNISCKYGSYRTDFFISNRDRLLYKDYLFQVFTPSFKPMLYIPKEFNNKELLLLTSDYKQEIDELFEIGRLFHVPKSENVVSLDIPNNNNDTAIIVCTGKDFDKYKIGMIGVTSYGDTYTVSTIKQYRHISQHVKQYELTPEQILQAGNNKVQLVYLNKITLENTQLPPSENNAIYGILYRVSDTEVVLVKLKDTSTDVCFHIHEKFEISTGYIENYTGSAITTTYGLYTLNYVVLVLPFGTLIPYINSTPGTSNFNLGKLDNRVAELILEGRVTREMYDKYMQYGYFIGHLAHLGVAGLSKKALTTDPRIIQRRKELLEKHKHELHDPTVLSAIEKELIQMDKEWIQGDSSEKYYAVNPDKAFNEHRKKMFITMGITPAFSKDSTQYEFTENSLNEGIKPENLVNVANEIRRGTYDRGIGTAKGGEQTKFILRVFNATRITSEDCRSKRGIEITLTENNYTQFIDRYLVDPHTGNITLLDKNTITKYIGKTIFIRSAMYCKTKDGLCYTCVGDNFRKLDRDSIGMLAVFIGSKFTSINMKSMHFSGIKSDTVTDISKYFVIP